jgi:hypothetical protein
MASGSPSGENKKEAENKFKEIINAYELLTEADDAVVNGVLSEMELTTITPAYTWVSCIKFWLREETQETFIEAQLVRGTDRFLDVHGNIISDKTTLGVSAAGKETVGKFADSPPPDSGLAWASREGGFWFNLIGIKLYADIKNAYFMSFKENTASALLEELDCVIDNWNDFIADKLKDVGKTREFQVLKASILERDRNQCAACGNAREANVHNIFSLSEHIANYLLNNHCSIKNVNVSDLSAFYEAKHNVLICSKCYIDDYGDSQIDYFLSLAGNEWPKRQNKQKAYFKTGDMESKLHRELDDKKLTSAKTLLARLNKIEAFQQNILGSPHERNTANIRLKVKVLLRAGEYAQAKRWAMRLERYLKKESDKKNENFLKGKQRNFIENNWDLVAGRVIDKIIELHKSGDFKYSKGYDGYDGIYPRYSIKKYRKLFEEAEKELVSNGQVQKGQT